MRTLLCGSVFSKAAVFIGLGTTGFPNVRTVGAQQAAPRPGTPVVSTPKTTGAKDLRSLKVKNVFTDGGGGARLGDRIVVEVEGLEEAVQGDDGISPGELVLYLNGYRLKDAHVQSIDLSRNLLGFQLERTDSTRSVWTRLLGKPKWSEPVRLQEVSVGLGDNGPIEAVDQNHPPVLNLIVFNRAWATICLILFLVLLALFWRLASRSGIIRDSGPPDPPTGAQKPFSLGRFQMAVWFFLVISSFVFIYLITGDYQTITEQALVLMGIGTGTALGAAAIDSNKRESSDKQLGSLRPAREKLQALIGVIIDKGAAAEAIIAANPPGSTLDHEAVNDLKIALAEKDAELKELDKQIADAAAGLTKPVSQGFFKDILTDANGISFHRFQMLMWTMVVGAFFVAGVYNSLAMPEFSTTLLALLGISAGTYLSFKFPERQN
jgi:hypothetical protein